MKRKGLSIPVLFQVFKACFFPTRTILEANESASSLYAWKNVLKGREVISKGALWRVEDGQQINIWGDNWLPTKSKAKVTSP